MWNCKWEGFTLIVRWEEDSPSVRLASSPIVESAKPNETPNPVGQIVEWRVL